jgi:hypothetical protein
VDGKAEGGRGVGRGIICTGTIQRQHMLELRLLAMLVAWHQMLPQSSYFIAQRWLSVAVFTSPNGLGAIHDHRHQYYTLTLPLSPAPGEAPKKSSSVPPIKRYVTYSLSEEALKG